MALKWKVLLRGVITGALRGSVFKQYLFCILVISSKSLGSVIMELADSKTRLSLTQKAAAMSRKTCVTVRTGIIYKGQN